MRTWKVDMKNSNRYTKYIEAKTREEARYKYMKEFGLHNYCNIRAVLA